MRIAIITSWFPSGKRPLYGIFVKNQAMALAEHYDVTVLLMKRSLRGYQKVEKFGNLTVITKGVFYLPNRSERFLSMWAAKYATFFEKENKERKFDVIHCHDHYGAYIGWTINNRTGIPYVTTMHNTSILSGKLADWKKEYLPKTLNNAHTNIAVGSQLADVLEKEHGISNVIVVPNYVDIDTFTIKADKKMGPFKFLFVGDLESRKGILELIEAFAQMKNKIAELHVVGDGILMEESKALAQNTGVSDKVVFHGLVPNQELPKYYNDVHAYVTFSRYETFSVTTLEAMSCGLPVLYTASGGPEYLVKKDMSIKVDIDDLSATAEKMDYLMDNYHNVSHEEIRNHVIKNFSSNSFFDKISSIYKSAIG